MLVVTLIVVENETHFVEMERGVFSHLTRLFIKYKQAPHSLAKMLKVAQRHHSRASTVLVGPLLNLYFYYCKGTTTTLECELWNSSHHHVNLLCFSLESYSNPPSILYCTNTMPMMLPELASGILSSYLFVVKIGDYVLLEMPTMMLCSNQRY